MAISKDLFLSILSVDAYNRGYDAGLADSFGNDPDGLGVQNAVLSSVKVVNDDASQAAQDADFYAIAYEVTNGSAIEGFNTGDIIISYRGTDAVGELFDTDFDIIVNDNFKRDQFSLAVDFFNTVQNANEGKEVVLTGHSLGGALAGYVGTIFRKEARLVDHIDFEGSLRAFAEGYETANAHLTWGLT